MLEAHLRKLAVAVIRQSDRNHPADGVLRDKFKAQREVSRDEARLVSGTVFSYFRWFGWLSGSSLDDAVERALTLDRDFSLSPEGFSSDDLQNKSIPAWAANVVDVSRDWIVALQREPELWLRAKAGVGERVSRRLRNCDVVHENLPDTLRYVGRDDLFRTPEFHAGEFELQDISSQAVGLITNPLPGETWWDACAGEGGKTLHLSDLMQNKGLIWASDRAEWRLRRLKQRAARASVFNYRTVLWDGGKKLPTKTKFDGVLVDAPCSGVGTWQRNPHARWTTTENDVRELAEIQKSLLAHVADSLKPGGRLVYSVCTLTRNETSEVADHFARSFPQFEPILLSNPLAPKEAARNQLWFWPQTSGGNGMFVCAWRKKD